jgi:stage V sporulation protein S
VTTTEDLSTVEDIIRVSSSSNANALGQAIAHSVYEMQVPKLRAIGAGAVNQAIKACAIARGYVAVRGMNLSVIPGFETVVIDGKDISTITLQLIVEHQ